MYTIIHKLTHSAAIALAVLSISGTAVADSLTNDAGAGSRQIPASTFQVSGPTRRARVPEVSTLAPTVSPTSTAPGKSNGEPAERLMPGIPGTGKGGNHLKAGADYVRVGNTPGNRNYDNVFYRARSPATVNWVVAQKCGWICMVRTF